MRSKWIKMLCPKTKLKNVYRKTYLMPNKVRFSVWYLTQILPVCKESREYDP